MLRLIIFFLLLIAAAHGGSWLLDHNGPVSAQWLGYRVETNTVFVFGVLTVLFLATVLLTWLYIRIKDAPHRIALHSRHKKHEKGLTLLREGYAALLMGEGERAATAAKHSGKYLPEEPLVAMLSSKAAQASGNHQLSHTHLTALLNHPVTEFMAIKGLIDEAITAGRYEQALELAKRAYTLYPDKEGVISSLLSVYKRMGKWNEALLFIEQMPKHPLRFLTHRQQPDVKREKALILFMRGQAERAAGEEMKAFATIREAYGFMPSFVPLALVYAHMTLDKGNVARTADIIEKTWKTSPHPALAKLYEALHKNDSPKKQVKHAKKLLSLASNHPESYLAVARAEIRNGDYSNARNHVKLALQTQESSPSLLLMSELEKREGSDGAADEWLAKARYAHDPAWQCKACGHKSEQWEMLCPSCNAIDSMAWNSGANNTLPALKAASG